MTESRHIMLDKPKVIASKKELLLSELSGIHMVKCLRNFKALKNRELELRNNIKTEIVSLKEKIKSVESSLPQDLIKKEEQKFQQEKKKTKPNPESDLQRELAEIKAKLARLG